MTKIRKKKERKSVRENVPLLSREKGARRKAWVKNKKVEGYARPFDGSRHERKKNMTTLGRLDGFGRVGGLRPEGGKEQRWGLTTN